MKFRSLLLVACMLVVPLLAMFSHHIPADVRATIRRSLRDTLADWLGRTAEASGPLQPSAAVRSPVSSGGNERTPAAGVSTVGTDTATTGLRPIGDAMADASEPPPLVAQLADRSRQARDQQSIDSRLKELGAVSFVCQPEPGAAGQHSSSCRIPVDASGQLQRVFQASGSDPVAASENLLQQVTAWRQRAAATPPVAITAGAVDPAAPTRFR